MPELLHILSSLGTFTFILGSLFGAGLGLTISEILEPLKKLRLVLLALIANFILIPVGTYVLSYGLNLDPNTHAGIMILACCAGAPFLPKLVSTAKGNIAGSIGLMVLLMVTTIFYLPVILPMVIPGLAVDAWALAKPLLFMMLLPLALGLGLKVWQPKVACQLKPLAEKLSMLGLLLTAIILLGLDYKIFTSAWGTGAYRLAFVFTVGALVIGYFSGIGDSSLKRVMMLGSGARNIAAALLIAAANFTEERVLTIVLIGSLIQFVVIFIVARALARYNN